MTSREIFPELGQSPAPGVKSRGVSPSPHRQQQPQQQQQHQHQQHQGQFTGAVTGLDLDPSIAAASSFSNSSFDPSNNNLSTCAESYGYTAAGYLSGTPASQTDQNYANSLQISQSYDTGLVPQFNESHGLSIQQQSQQLQQQPHIDDNFSSLLNSSTTDYDFSSVYQNHSPSSNTAPEYDSSLLLDPQVHQQSHPTQLPSSHPSTSPQISPLEQQQRSSPGAMSPQGSTTAYYTPQHSRHASLDPASAAFLTSNAHPDWQAVMGNNAAFQGHRRAPSEVSEISSAAPSPYLSQHESFDGVDNDPSPLLAPQNDPSLYDNALGIENFTLSEQQHQGFSPAHSPYISPRLMPQQGQEMMPNVPYLSRPAPNTQYPTPPNDMYANGQEAMMNVPQGPHPSGDIGQASQMAPPSINVEFAPPSRIPSFGPAKPANDLDSLSPPPSSTRKSPCIRFSFVNRVLTKTCRLPRA